MIHIVFEKNTCSSAKESVILIAPEEESVSAKEYRISGTHGLEHKSAGR